MKNHLYNSSIGKVAWFVRRFGVRELFLKPLRQLAAPLILPGLPREQFRFRGRPYDYLLHRYNITWAGERAVEVPISARLVENASGRVLEVGNVLPHYGITGHDVVDKFERAPGVINEDILEFRPTHRYSLIVSISTFEHIGFDDESGDSGAKILQAIQKCRSLLSSEGRLFITVPTGYNPALDDLIRNDALPSAERLWLVRTGFTQWEECDSAMAMSRLYGTRFPYANALLLAYFPGLP